MRHVSSAFSQGEDKRIKDLVYKEKIGRKQAQERGLYVYFSKKQCSCGFFLRYTSCSDCITCRSSKKNEKLRERCVDADKVKVRRSIEDIKEQNQGDYWDSLLDD